MHGESDLREREDGMKSPSVLRSVPSIRTELETIKIQPQLKVRATSPVTVNGAPARFARTGVVAPQTACICVECYPGDYHPLPTTVSRRFSRLDLVTTD